MSIKELKGNTYEVKRTYFLDRVYKGENIYKNVFKLYKNDKLVKEFTNGNGHVEKSFRKNIDKVVVVFFSEDGFEEFKCLKDENAVKRQSYGRKYIML